MQTVKRHVVFLAGHSVPLVCLSKWSIRCNRSAVGHTPACVSDTLADLTVHPVRTAPLLSVPRMIDDPPNSEQKIGQDEGVTKLLGLVTSLVRENKENLWYYNSQIVVGYMIFGRVLYV